MELSEELGRVTGPETARDSMQAGVIRAFRAGPRFLVGFDGPGIDGKPATWCTIPGPGRGSLVAGRGSNATIGPESRDFRPV